MSLAEPRKPMQKRSKIKRDAVIVAAKELFAQKGYNSVSTKDIAEHAGIAIGSLYSYFADKRDIFFVLMEECNEEFAQQSALMFSSIDLEKDAPEKIVAHCIDALFGMMDIYGNLHSDYLNYVAGGQEEVRLFFAEQNKGMMDFLLRAMSIWGSKLRVADNQVAAQVVLEISFTIADMASSGRSAIAEEDIKTELKNIVCRYLFK